MTSVQGADPVVAALLDSLRDALDADHVLTESIAPYLADETETRSLRGHADAVVRPGTAEEVALVVAACYRAGVAIVPRGGGTGFAGGAVPTGGIVVSLERLDRIRAFDPLLWRIEVEAGVLTGRVRGLARDNGLLFPPDPGAAESSQIGGNIATNAGGPHAFKYGTTGAWVLGLEAVVPPGELIKLGGPIRKDVAGYDLKSLMIGSEGTLGIVTAAWLRLIPAPGAALPVAATYASTADGCNAIQNVVANGLMVSALEYLDAGTLRAAGATFPGGLSDGAAFMVVAEADGGRAEAARVRQEVREVLQEGATAVVAPSEPSQVSALWRWRDGVSYAVTAQRGGKVSEDIVVPLDRLREAIDGTVAIGERHSLAACSWGHAGDGNLHSTFLVDRDDAEELERAEAAAQDLFGLARDLSGSVTGEHGIGLVKRGQLAQQWAPGALALHRSIKQAFDPAGLLNPGKKD